MINARQAPITSSKFQRLIQVKDVASKFPTRSRRGWHVFPGAILVSGEEAAQVDRFRYILSHGVKEGLVAHAQDWPGVHGVRELLAGEPIRGLWFDRTAEYAARNRGEDFDRLKYATEQTFELTPLPCWSQSRLRPRAAAAT